MTSRVLACAMLALVALPPAFADEGRVPIHETTTITSPGTYFVSRAISGAGPLIRVEADDVDIDLNGFTLSPSSGAGVYVSDFDRVAIHDGFIAGGQYAVRLVNVEGARIERIGTSESSGASLRVVDSTGIVIRDGIVRDSGQEGILFDATNLSDPAQVEITGMQVAGSGDTGISLVNAGSSLISGNTIGLPAGRGIYLESSFGVQVYGNAIRGTGLAGIALVGSLGCQLVENVIRATGTDGIILDADSHDSTVSTNQVTAGDTYGLRVGGDRNIVELNGLNGNADWGLYFNVNAAGNVYRANVARGNDGAMCNGSGAADSDFCDDGSGNTSNGDNFAQNQL